MHKNIVCNVRMPEEMRYALRIAALKNKMTVQDVLFEAAKRYISEHGDNIGESDDNDDDFYNPANIRRLEHSLEHAMQGKIVIKTMEELERMADE